MGGAAQQIAPKGDATTSTAKKGNWHGRPLLHALFDAFVRKIHSVIHFDRNGVSWESADIRGRVPIQDPRFRDGVIENLALTVTGDGAALVYGTSYTIPSGEIWELLNGTTKNDDTPAGCKLILGFDDGNDGVWVDMITGNMADQGTTVLGTSLWYRILANQGSEMSQHFGIAGERLTLACNADLADTKISEALVKVKKVTV